MKLAIFKPQLYLTALLLTIGLPACQLLPHSNTTTQAQRSNITNSNQLSHLSQNTLLAAGYQHSQCMADFSNCTALVEALFLHTYDKTRLAVLAELNYAYARHLRARSDCQPELIRPPIDNYYSNAPLDKHAQAAITAAQRDCLAHYRQALYQTLRYSYAHMFFEPLTGTTTDDHAIIDAQALKTQDLYHLSLHAIINEVQKKENGGFYNSQHYAIKDANNDTAAQLHFYRIDSQNPDNSTDHLHFYISNDANYTNTLQADDNGILDDISSTFDNPSLNTISTRPGLGVGYVASIQGRHTLTLKNLLDNSQISKSNDSSTRIHPMQHLNLTAVIIPAGKTLVDVLASRDFYAYFLNPYANTHISLFDKHYPLYADFSASYGKWIKENQFGRIGVAGMLARTDTRLPELFMLEPYHPNKKIIVMLHGLASSPETWIQLTNSLMADPVLREHYQVWQVFYATNLPILENRYQIHKLITDAFLQVSTDAPTYTDHNNVIIGHSMGGVLARLLVADDDLLTRLDDLDVSADSSTNINDSNMNQAAINITQPSILNDTQPTDIKLSNSELRKLLHTTYRQDFDERFTLTALPQFGRAIFISAPHRGTDYADRWFTRAIRRTIHVPLSITQNITKVLNQGDQKRGHYIGSLYLDNGASQLSDRSAFMALTREVKPGVPFHSVIANNTGMPSDMSTVSEHISDGIVPYDSAHLENAASETILSGGHSIHENPKTIWHLRQILHAHLQAMPAAQK